MIAYVQGKFQFVSPAVVYVNVQGVGYEVYISLHTYSAIQALPEGQLYTYLLIKEDAHALYGFATIAEKELFLQLLSVSGIGANTARMMLSSIAPPDITRAIIQGDIRVLESIKGIGKKTAERAILELKDKLAKAQLTDLANTPTLDSTTHFNHNTDAVNALQALGIARNIAENAVKKAVAVLPEGSIVEIIIKKALQLI